MRVSSFVTYGLIAGSDRQTQDSTVPCVTSPRPAAHKFPSWSRTPIEVHLTPVCCGLKPGICWQSVTMRLEPPLLESVWQPKSGSTLTVWPPNGRQGRVASGARQARTRCNIDK
jgi:hypothetical protein